MTPHELNLHLEAYSEKNTYESEQALIMAYLTAGWQRVKKLPNLEKILDDLKKPKQKKAQTPEEMLAQVKRLHKKMSK